MDEGVPAFRKPGTETHADFTLVMVKGVPGKYRLGEPFEYVKPGYAAGPHNYRKTVPTDITAFTTDLASIPFFATWLVPRDGKHTPAALLHDSLYADARRIAATRGRVKAFEEADRVFRGAMDVTGVPLVRRWLMFAAVAIGTRLRGSRWRAVLSGASITLTILAALVFNLLWVNEAFDGSLDWVPQKLSRFLNWASSVDLLAFLPDDLSFVPEVSPETAGIITIASTLLWGRTIGTGVLGATAIMLFGYPLLLAGWSFGVYWAIEAATAVALKIGGAERVNDVGILRTKNQLTTD